MPQLDLFSYNAVVIWLIIILSISYNIILVTGLARLYKIFFLRQKKIEFMLDSNNKYEKEIFCLCKLFLQFAVIVEYICMNIELILSIFFEKIICIDSNFSKVKIKNYNFWLQYFELFFCYEVI